MRIGNFITAHLPFTYYILYTNHMKNKLKKLVKHPATMWGAVIVGILALLLVLAFGAQAAYSRLYENRIFPGVKILDVRLNGLTKTEARKEIQESIDENLSKGLRFVFQGKEVQLDPTLPAIDQDASRDLIRYQIEESLEKAFQTGRSGNWMKNLSYQIAARIRPMSIPAEIQIDRIAIDEALHRAFEDKISPPKDAKFSVVFSSDNIPYVHIENEQSGDVLKTEPAIEELKGQLENLDFKLITVTGEKASPSIMREDLEPLINYLEDYLERPELTFEYNTVKFSVTPKMLSDWIVVKSEHGQFYLDIDDELFAKALREYAPDIESEVKNGSLVIKDGKIESFVPGTIGMTFDIEKTLAAVREEWPEKTKFPIEIDTQEGSLLGDDPERLGIKEIIGVGTSNFSGSPNNRRKNIRKGAQILTGVLIAPGEDFSLLKALGQIDGEHGWFPELVIKGNKTVPEFGGGLCQIGTTVFRAALNSGLKITQRSSHSYRVSYYEPAGTDATIYDPAPDMRFINDTGNHILINAYSLGDELYFEYWGTEDGRKVDPYKPAIYNIVSPPAIKLIETLDLEPGKKQCTESAHAGADAHFTYHVTYADGTEHEEVFRSHYRPWQAVCLVGVEELSEPESATSTDAVLEE